MLEIKELESRACGCCVGSVGVGLLHGWLQNSYTIVYNRHHKSAGWEVEAGPELNRKRKPRI